MTFYISTKRAAFETSKTRVLSTNLTVADILATTKEQNIEIDIGIRHDKISHLDTDISKSQSVGDIIEISGETLMGNPFSTIVTARDATPKMEPSKTASLATTSENLKPATVFEPKMQSPTAHLKILRNSHTFSDRNSPYFSPALGNASDAIIRLRANTYRSLRLDSHKLEFFTKRKDKLHLIVDDEYDSAMADIKAWKAEAAEMRDNNDQWVIDVFGANNALLQQQELEKAFNDDEKIDITEELEQFMQADGRSLSELEELEKDVIRASRSSPYFPDDFDSEADSDEEDEEDDHLYGFPLPTSTNKTISHSNSEDETTEDENYETDSEDESTYEDATANALLPDVFSWADESDDMEELTPAPFEERYDNLINKIYHKLNNFRDGLEAMKEYLSDKNTFTLRKMELAQRPKRITPCKWDIQRLDISKNDLEQSTDAIPTIRLITPEGDICELIETFPTSKFQGPAWDKYLEERDYESKKLRMCILSRETFEDWTARRAGEALCKEAQAKDLEIHMKEMSEDVVDEDLFSQPTLAEAIENLHQYQTILANNVQMITAETRMIATRLKDAEEAQKLIEQRAQINLDHHNSKEKIKYAIVSLDLKARNEDGLELYMDKETGIIGYFNNSFMNGEEFSGPASIMFVGPLAAKLLNKTWIITDALPIAEKHVNYAKLKSFDPYRPVRRNTKNVALSVIHYRKKENIEYLELGALGYQYSQTEDRKRGYKIDYIIGIAIFEAQYNNKIARAKANRDKKMWKKPKDGRKAAALEKREELEERKRSKIKALEE
ncbi:uncharacterized protein PAC_03917 [Phialocephala subalpina]|uniref:Uncharacterized protein n=1 Tax=Phialocephala subalpina TaxID=576137 RepID=A0A1L7WMN0_9HELO|nr:uncharacterized protein PAC_03917 [Phialocephala subalpina]